MRLLDPLHPWTPGLRLAIPYLGIVGLVGVRSRFGRWTIADLAMAGLVIGVVVTIAVIVGRRRARYRASVRGRLGRLESRDAVRLAPAMESLRQPDRGSLGREIEDHEPNGDGITVGDQGSSDGTPGDPVTFLSDLRDRVEELPGAGAPALRLVESVRDVPDPSGDDEFSRLSAEELAMLFNRYEQLSADAIGPDDADRLETDAELWLDLVEGPASACIDAARSSAEDHWIQLHSGDAVCKPRNSDSWIWIEFDQQEPAVSVVALSGAPAAGPIEPVSVVIRSDFKRIGPTPELSAVARHFE